MSTLNDVSSPSPKASLPHRLSRLCKLKADALQTWAVLPSTRGVIKCSLAYTIASLATFVPFLSDFLGRPGGKHVVATITVYFHASRSVGSMVEAVMIAIVAIAYAEIVSVLSMVTSVLVGAHLGQVALAHALVVVVFIGGGFGFMSWVKQRMGNPLVNVASTLASLAIISVVTKENHVVSNVFSNQKIVQVLKILVMGVTSSTTVNLLLWRVSARSSLQKSVDTAYGQLADMFRLVAEGVLDGTFLFRAERDQGLSGAISNFNRTKGQMHKNMREARFEYYVIGCEKRCHLSEAVVRLIEELSQSIGAFRSGSSMLSDVLQESSAARGQLASRDGSVNQDVNVAHTPLDVYEGFLAHIKAAMSDLTNGIMKALQLDHHDEMEQPVAAELMDAVKSFGIARAEALENFYQDAKQVRSKQGQADLEQIAAACGHFTFSLLLVADHAQNHLTVLEDMHFLDHNEQRTWSWMCFWRKQVKAGKLRARGGPEEDGLIQQPSVPAARPGLPSRTISVTGKTVRRDSGLRRLVANLLAPIRKLARDDILFGVKVGIGAALWASLAFISETRDWYNHYRGEWGLLSFMIVCSMTVGASNTTGWSRFLGTLLGAFFSIANWNISQGNGIALVFLGWATGFFNFHLIVAQGRAPLGRMTLLAYNVSTLYAYSMSQKLDNDDDGSDEELGGQPNILEIAKHRVISVTAGILWGLIVCRVVWPISARQEFKQGISALCLQMGLIWKRGPLAILLRTDCTRSYLETGEQHAMQKEAARLESLRQSASFEFDLKGPFPFEETGHLLRTLNRILDGFYAMSLITHRSGSLTTGERALLQFTANERAVLCDRICHIFHVIASSMMLEYPMTNAVPNIASLRDQLLGKVFEFRNAQEQAHLDNGEENLSLGDLAIKVEESDYAIMYAYVLVTGQVANELKKMEKEIQGLYGVLTEESLDPTQT